MKLLFLQSFLSKAFVFGEMGEWLIRQLADA